MTQLIAMTKIFNAPVEKVWQVWTDPELVKRWWGPEHFTCGIAELDFREGGTSLVSMKASREMGGQEWYSAWKYTQIIPHKTIAFVHACPTGRVTG